MTDELEESGLYKLLNGQKVGPLREVDGLWYAAGSPLVWTSFGVEIHSEPGVEDLNTAGKWPTHADVGIGGRQQATGDIRMTIQMKEHSRYRLKNGWKIGGIYYRDGVWHSGGVTCEWTADGKASWGSDFDVVEECPVHDDISANAVAAVAAALDEAIGVAEAKLSEDGPVEIEAIADGTQLFESATMIGLAEDFDGAEIKTMILDEAGRIVTGARRGAYGTPEQNFERIARFWQAYFENTGRPEAKITAKDVSPLMRFVKEARLCETPDHYDSFVDLAGYTATGAEVNKVKKPA